MSHCRATEGRGTGGCQAEDGGSATLPPQAKPRTQIDLDRDMDIYIYVHAYLQCRYIYIYTCRYTHMYIDVDIRIDIDIGINIGVEKRYLSKPMGELQTFTSSLFDLHEKLNFEFLGGWKVKPCLRPQ